VFFLSLVRENSLRLLPLPARGRGFPPLRRPSLYAFRLGHPGVEKSRVSPGIQMCRWLWKSVRKTNNWIVGKTAYQNGPNQVHWQRVEQFRKCRRALRTKCLRRIFRSASRQVADEGTSIVEKSTVEDLVEKSGMPRRVLMNARAGRSRPHRKSKERLKSTPGGLGLI
jgi:hypothetical protein